MQGRNRCSHPWHTSCTYPRQNVCGTRMTLEAKRFGRYALAALVGILTFAAGSLTVRGASWQSPDSIREAARAMALRNGATDVEAVAVDERLKLPECGDALKTEMQRVIQRGSGTVTV